jgi:hypothetical protein
MFQLCGLILVVPTIMMNETTIVFMNTKTLFIVADSLTPISKNTFEEIRQFSSTFKEPTNPARNITIANIPTTTIVIPKARKSGYGPNPLTAMGIADRNAVVILLSHSESMYWLKAFAVLADP